MIFSKTFEEKRKLINDLCKQFEGKEDPSILKSLFSTANIKDRVKGDNLEERLIKTPYSNLSNKDLLALFNFDNVKNLDVQNATLILQELHNRECEQSNIEPRYIVEVRDTKISNCFGYMITGANELNINLGELQKALSTPQDNKNFYCRNQKTIGYHTAFTLIHETQHTCQMENAINFALGKDTKEEQGRDAVFFLMNVIQEYANKNDRDLAEYIYKNYSLDFTEHCSNMAPIKFMAKAIKNDEISDPLLLGCMANRIRNDIHIEEQSTSKRIEEMDNVVNYLYGIFKDKFMDGPIKQKTVEVLDEYLKYDKNGNSPFTSTLKNDFKNAKNMISYCETHCKNDNFEHASIN